MPAESTPISTPAAKPGGDGKLLFLESIRGLAALIVVFHHCLLGFHPGFESDRFWWTFPMHLIHDGPFAVRIFFVLSGFVLSYSYFRRRDPRVITSAAIRRYFRLMIPAGSAVMIAWLFIVSNLYFNEAAADRMQMPQTAWLRQFDAHKSFPEAVKDAVFRTFFAFDFKTTMNGNLWTMSYELQGSFLVFAILGIFGILEPLRRRIILYGVLVFLCLWTKNHFFADFIVGIALCDAFIAGSLGQWKLGAVTGVLLVACGATIGASVHARFFERIHAYALADFAPTVGAAMIIGAALYSPFLRRHLHGAWAVFLGRISFPLYLIHLTVLHTASCWIYLALRNAGQSHLAAGVAAAFTTVALSIAVAAALYRLVDEPSVRFGKAFEERFFPKNSNK